MIFDASALIYRFYHALPPLTNSKNELIQGIYGVANVILKVLLETKPDFAAAALDSKEKTFRKEEFQEYKIHRPGAPDELVQQLKILPEIFPMFGIRAFKKPGFEADDLIGTISEKFKNELDLKITIISGDLDMLQLVSGEKIVAEIIKSGANNNEIYDEKKVIERYGLTPKELPDYKGLIGDVSDNIPGIKGIGPKAAQKLVSEFKTIEEIYENLAIITPRIAEKLEGKKENAFLFRRLSTIKRDVDIGLFGLNDLKIEEFRTEKLKEWLKTFGFQSLVKRLEQT